MATTVLILPPSDACSASDIERWISAETEELAIEIFATCYGCTMPQAWNRAIAELPDLLSFAAQWDADAAPPVVLALEARR